MYQRRLALLLFAPSVMSGVVAVGMALLLTAYGAWAYIQDNQLFYGLFSGAYGLQTFVWDVSYEPLTWQRTFLSSPVAYYVLVGGVAIAAGMAVFAALQILGVVRRESMAIFDTDASRAEYRRETVSRLGLRTISLIGWALYTAFFVSTLLPFNSLLNETGVELIEANNPSGWFACAGSFALLALSLHLHVIFVRLVALRPRLFGGMDDIERAEAAGEHKIDAV